MHLSGRLDPQWAAPARDGSHHVDRTPAQVIGDMLSWPELRMGVNRARVELAVRDVVPMRGRTVITGPPTAGQSGWPVARSQVFGPSKSRGAENYDGDEWMGNSWIRSGG